LDAAIVIILYLCVVIAEFVPLIKEKNKKQTWVYAIALSISFCVLILVGIGFSIPGPSGLIKTVVEKALSFKL